MLQAADQQQTTAFIDLDAVTLEYQSGTVALEDTTMKVARGEFVAVVGPSGCGKSSMLKLVSGLHPPKVGTVRVGGSVVTSPISICGMAFQNANLLPWRTTIENVMLPLEIVSPYAGQMRRRRKEFLADARALLELVGLGGFEDKYPWELSGGMQQRASLCRALIHKPEILLLDEPFGALDAFTREDLWATLQTLGAERRPTTILVTHDLREAVYLADTIYVFSPRPGRILARESVPFPRPRTLQTTFEPHFVELVQKLRDKIAPGR